MATIYEIRKANLKTLMERQSPTSIAQLMGWTNPSFLSQMVSTNAARQKNVSEKTARKLELVLHLDYGWMDVERDTSDGRSGATYDAKYTRLPDENSPPPVVKEPAAPISLLDSDRFGETAELVGRCIDQAGVSIPHAKFAQIVTLTYERGTNDEQQMKDYIGKLLRLLK